MRALLFLDRCLFRRALLWTFGHLNHHGPALTHTDSLTAPLSLIAPMQLPSILTLRYLLSHLLPASHHLLNQPAYLPAPLHQVSLHLPHLLPLPLDPPVALSQR